MTSKHPLEEFHDNFFDLYSFDHSAGHCKVIFDELDVLVLCLEKSGSWEQSLRDITNLDEITLTKSNSIAEKKVSILHDQFVNELKLPKQKLQEIYYGNNKQQKYIAWFYTEEEVGEMFNDAVYLFGQYG
ncbi:hypothetical protein [Marinobacter metalliresistant]|uniref:Uncharacterized protein n=1 Tax=Marinobacter metalliresistant TaxID=2961995 RepID=A0ABZ2W4S2_9GAMM